MRSAPDLSRWMPQNLRSNIKVRASNWFRGGLLALALSAVAFPQIPRSHPTPEARPANPNPQQPGPSSTTNPTNALPAPTGPPPTYGGVNLDNVSLTQVIDMLARQLKINYILDQIGRAHV